MYKPIKRFMVSVIALIMLITTISTTTFTNVEAADESIRYGDIDNTNTVNANDALLVLQTSVGKETLNNNQKVLADVNDDGSITAEDALLILQYAVNKISKFPIENNYSAGDTWIVEGQWKFTVDSVSTHYMCNEFSDYNNLAQCIIITYSYENIGYTGDFQDLYFSCMSFYVYDGSGEAAELYPCTHTKFPKVCSPGTKCSGAQEAYALYNNSSEIMLKVEYYTSNNTGKQEATFKLNVN